MRLRLKASPRFWGYLLSKVTSTENLCQGLSVPFRGNLIVVGYHPNLFLSKSGHLSKLIFLQFFLTLDVIVIVLTFLCFSPSLIIINFFYYYHRLNKSMVNLYL